MMSELGTSPINLYASHADLFGKLGALHEEMAEKGLSPKLSHLIELRVSQINGCAFCIDMHVTAARKEGETSERLDRLVVWRQVDLFSPSEKAALAWAEALTHLEPRTDFASARAELRQHFDEDIIVLISIDVAMINLWNRLQISAH